MKNNNYKQQKKYYEKYLDKYDIEIARFHMLNYSLVIEKWKNFVKGKTVLEIGAGSGYCAKNLAPLAKKYFITDITAKQLINAKKQTSNLKNTVYQLEKAEALSFNNNKFDVVISYGVFHHIVDYKKAISESLRVLKKGGVLLAFEPNNNKYIINDEVDFIIVFFYYLLWPLKLLIYLKLLFKKCFANNGGELNKRHPGHPSKIPPTEISRVLNYNNITVFNIETFLFPIIPLRIVKRINCLYRFDIWLSKYIDKIKRFRGRGHLILWQAVK